MHNGTGHTEVGVPVQKPFCSKVACVLKHVHAAQPGLALCRHNGLSHLLSLLQQVSSMWKLRSFASCPHIGGPHTTKQQVGGGMLVSPADKLKELLDVFFNI